MTLSLFFVLIAIGGIVLLVLRRGENGETPPPGNGGNGGPSQEDRDRERIREAFEADLQSKGLFGQLQGASPQEIYQDYLLHHTEYVRNKYMADLRRRGWTGTTLPGNSPEAIYPRYLAEFDILVAQARAEAIERIRAFYVGDLQRRGWPGDHLAGGSEDEIFVNYVDAYNTLVAVTHDVIPPLPDQSGGPTTEPRFNTGDRVRFINTDVSGIVISRVWSDGFGMWLYRLDVSAGQIRENALALATGPEPPPVAPSPPQFRLGQRVHTPRPALETIANYRWDATVNAYFYRMEDRPFTWWQESELTAFRGVPTPEPTPN